MRDFLAKGRETDPPVTSAYVGKNADLFAAVSRLYIPDKAMVLDCTWGKGAFWRNTDTDRFWLIGTDIDTDIEDRQGKAKAIYPGINYHHLNIATIGTYFDVVVFDPPYKSGGGTSHESMVGRYGLEHITSDTPSGHGNVNAVITEYAIGLEQAYKVLKSDGLLMVKCQDMVESGKQHWMHMAVANMGEELGFYLRDLFVLVNGKKPMMRHGHQLHSRKNVSYLWVMQK